jgi:hypothetical protein
VTADSVPPAGDGADRDLPSFVGRPLPPSLRRRVIVIEPGQARAYDDGEWRDAIVVVERGHVELAPHGDARRCFGRGDILVLAGLGLRSLHNPGREPTVLVAVSRRAAAGPD